MEHDHTAMACHFRHDADRYRKLAGGTPSPTMAGRLAAIADECERDATLLAEKPSEFSDTAADGNIVATRRSE